MSTPRVVLECGRNRLIAALHGLVLYDRFDLGVGKFLERYGEYFEDEVAVFRAFCPPGAIVIDAGANIGTHTLALSRLVGRGGRVYAFEPQNRVFTLLAANVALNGIENVDCIRAALGEADGEVTLGDLPADRQLNYGGASLAQLAGPLRTPVYALDRYLPNLPHLELIKIDVEGMEIEVLKGARQLLAKFQPAVYAENNQPQKSAELVTLLRDAGYRVYWHMPSHFRKGNFYAEASPMMATQLVDTKPGSEYLDSVGIAINILAVRPSLKVEGVREIVDVEEHPLKRPYAPSFVTP